MSYKLTNKKISPVNPPCRKAIYHSPEEAQDMIKYMEENRGTGKEIRVYKCTVCGFWHLTSKTR